MTVDDESIKKANKKKSKIEISEPLKQTVGLVLLSMVDVVDEDDDENDDQDKDDDTDDYRRGGGSQRIIG